MIILRGEKKPLKSASSTWYSLKVQTGDYIHKMHVYNYYYDTFCLTT